MSEFVAFCGGATRPLAVVLEIHAPGSVLTLMADDPIETVFDGLLGLGAASFAAHELGTGQTRAARKRCDDRRRQVGQLRDRARRLALPTFSLSGIADGPARLGAYCVSEARCG